MKVLVLSKFPEYKPLFEKMAIPFVFTSSVDEAVKIVESPNESVDIYFGEPALLGPLLDKSKNPSLKWIQSTFAGVDAFCKEGRPRNYVLTKMVDIFAPIMSEYVFAYALAHFRYLDKYRENQKEHKWEFLPYSYICNRSILVLGTGSIGEGIARAANGFGIKNIWGFNRTGKKVDYFTEIVTERSRLLECVSKADVIVNVLPATPLTLNFMDREILSKVSSKAILILSGRGTTFDIPALKELIAAGHITRTVIDVFPKEPLPQDDSFWTLPGVTVTSHTAAASITEVIMEVFAENLERYEKGEQMKGVVDFEQGY